LGSMASLILTTCIRRHDDEVQIYAFDAMMLDGDDLRRLPLSMRKANSQRLLSRRPDGIFIAPFEQGEICFGKPASLALRAWSLRTAIDSIAPGHRRTGQSEKPEASAMTQVNKAFV
jgi:hypothetical protein